VSRHLCDFVGGVGDSAVHPSVEATLRSPKPWVLSGLSGGAWGIGFLSGHSLELRASSGVRLGLPSVGSPGS
jgi:hypothetical protein